MPLRRCCWARRAANCCAGSRTGGQAPRASLPFASTMSADQGPRHISDLPHDLLARCLDLLSPRTLAICSCVSAGWRQMVAECFVRSGERYFGALWPLEPLHPPPWSGAEWQRCYAERQAASRAWLGRPATDTLAGHSSAVKSCAMLPQQGMLFTGGVDRCVRAWDLLSGTQLAVSRRHAGTVRCIAADSALLASGSSDHCIRVWLRGSGGSSSSSSGGGSSDAAEEGGPLDRGGAPHPPPLPVQQQQQAAQQAPLQQQLPFDLAGERAVLAGHAGPVSSLQLTPEVLVSGSWDCTIRVWDRSSLGCIQLVHTDDWVSALSLRGNLLAAACGKEVLLFSLESGVLHRLASLACPSLTGITTTTNGSSGSGGLGGGHSAAVAVTCVECSADGHSLFIGGADGSVWLADLSSLVASSSSNGSLPRPVLLQRQAAEVAGLSWDHPWLAVADRSGSVVLLDGGAATAAGAAAVEGSTRLTGAASTSSSAGSSSSKKRQQKQQAVQAVRVLHASGMGGAGAGAAAQCVCLAGCWAAAGLDCGTVLTWDGSKGLQQQAAAAAARQAKAERRQRNLDRQAAQRAQRGHKASGAAAKGSGSSSSGISGGGALPPSLPPSAVAERQAGQEARWAGATCVSSSGLPSSTGGPRPSISATGEPMGGVQGFPLSASPPQALGKTPSTGRLRVPPPPRPEALAAAAAAAALPGSSSCRQQAWQVLRPARRAASGGGGSSRAVGGGAGVPEGGSSLAV